jgi:hypothetical protein
VRLPRRISPGAAARRSLLFDTVAALAIFLLAVSVAAGIGVVGFIAVPVALVLFTWFLIEAAVRRFRRPRKRRSSEPAAELPAAAGAEERRSDGEQHHHELQGHREADAGEA